MARDDWVPFDFLLGEKYSGYFQAINASRDLKVVPSKLPKLFWGLTHEQRRRLATKMLEEGHTGDDLEHAIRVYVGGERRRRPRGPTSTQPWITTDGGEFVDLGGRGADGRPFPPLRYRPRAPFLAVDSEEACLHGSDRRVEKPHERAECGPARKRREIQELMRKRVQVQEEYLMGLEADRKDWRRYRTHIVKNRAMKSKHKLLRRRLSYAGGDLTNTSASETSSFDEEKHRHEKAHLAQLVASVRTADRLARAERATIGRWERDLLRAIRDETGNKQRPSTALSGASDPDRFDGRSSRKAGITQALRLLGVVKSFARDPPHQPPEPAADQEAEEGLDDTQGQQVSNGGTGDETHKMRPDMPLEAEVTDDGKTKETGQAAPAAERGEVPSPAPAGVGELHAETEDSVRHTVQTLLRVSSTMAMATARPLGIKPPPVLMVDKDETRGSALTHAKTTDRPSSQSLRRRKSSSSLNVFRGGGYRNSQHISSACVARGSSSNSVERAMRERPLPFQGWPSASAILDLDALSAAGSGATSRVPPACPSGQFAPMTEEEVALFFLDRYQNRGRQPDTQPPGKEKLDSSAAAPG